MQKTRDLANHACKTEEIKVGDEKVALEQIKYATKLKGRLSCMETKVKCWDQESVDVEQALGEKYFTSCHARI